MKDDNMITTKYVRDHAAELEKAMKKRHSSYGISAILQTDEKIRRLKTELQGMQAERNSASLKISEAKKNGLDVGDAIARLKTLKEGIEKAQSELDSLDEGMEGTLMSLPNFVHDSVPEGTSEEDNIELRKVGEIKKKSSKGHEEILEDLGLLDMGRAAKVAGARFYYITGDLAILDIALQRFVLDEISRRGYTAVIPPYMIRKKYFAGAAPIAQFKDAIYRVTDPEEAAAGSEGLERTDENLYLIGTAEHAIATMHADEVLQGSALPLRYAGISPCFRREAGSHGKDTKGIFRVHQFHKVEQFIFAREDDSWKYLDELVANSEGILQKLGIPYRAMVLSTGNMGVQVAKTIDLEGWMPSQGKYRELMSCSNCMDWQSVRLDIKYDAGGERKYVHTLNATASAIERTLVAIVENYANEDGTIDVPKALVPYMGKEKIGKA